MEEEVEVEVEAEVARNAFLWNPDFRRGSKTWWKSECRSGGNICWKIGYRRGCNIGCGYIWRWYTGGWLGWRLGCRSSCPFERQRRLVLCLSRKCCCFFMGCRSRSVKFIKHRTFSRWMCWTGRLVFCFFFLSFFFFFFLAAEVNIFSLMYSLTFSLNSSKIEPERSK